MLNKSCALKALCIIACISILLNRQTSATPKCPSMTRSCECIRGINLELACPTYMNPSISVRIEEQAKQNYRIEVDCTTSDERIYTSLPELDLIGNATTAKFKWCPMPASGTPIVSILKRMGIESTQTLTLTSQSDQTIVRQHLSGLKNLTHLSINGFGLSNVRDDFFDDVTNITLLDIRANNINFPSKIFDKLTQLRFLELGFNLSQLDDGIFRNQKNLRILNLWGNNLRNLSKNAFEGISSEIELDLSNNRIETMQPDIFVHLTNMTVINLSSNEFESLPEGLFEHNRNLRHIRLMNNRVTLKALPKRFLANLKKLEEVSIQCNLSVLPEDTFAGSSNLKILHLQNNALEKIPAGLLQSQHQLEELDLSDNEIITLDDQLFSKTSSLKILRLSQNRLTTISKNLLRGLNHLEQLHLENNKLQFIHMDAFENTNLHEINLHNNLLTFATDDPPFQSLGNLETLDLSNNRLTRFPKQFSLNCLNLRDLDISNNNLTSMNFVYMEFLWRNDITINLSHNNIRSIFVHSDSYKEPSQKSKWILNDNPLQCDCKILNLVKLARGEISNIAESKVNYVYDALHCAQPDTFAGKSIYELPPQTLLCPLDSTETTLKYCPNECTCWWRPYDESAILNCSNANLERFPNITKIRNDRYKQIEMHLENNQITQLPRIVTDGYRHLTHLYLQNNSIAAIVADNVPSNLSVLDVSGNQLSKMNSSLMAALNSTHSLKSLKIGTNPWICDCKAEELKSFLIINRHIADVQNIRCKDGTRIIDRKDLCPFDRTIAIAIGAVVALFGLLIGTIAALYYKYQQEIKVWLFAHNLCLWFVTEEELDKDKKYDAFISFSHHDEDFVNEHLVPELESGPHPFKTCLHFRDWVAGEFIPTQIANSVKNSRRTIIVLSSNFLDSIWSRMEFQAAHKTALSEGRVRVIVIILGEIPPIDELDDEMQCYLKTNTYVKWGDPWFFDKLRYALPHPSKYQPRSLIKSTIKSSIDDKLELIKPISVTPPLTTPPTDQANNNPLIAKLNAENSKYISNGLNGFNGHVNNAFIINPNAKQSDV